MVIQGVVAREDPAALARMAGTPKGTLAMATAAAAVQADRHLLMAEAEQPWLAELAAQGGLQALGVPGP